MSLNQTLIDQINTPVKGADAGGVSPFDWGATGLTAPAATLDVTGDGFFDPSANLFLDPTVYGGAGGLGAQGQPGTSTVPTLVGTNGTYVDDWAAGSDGGPAGAGGIGGSANFSFANDTIGSAASPYGGEVAITAKTFGGEGAGGVEGAYGGYGGFVGENPETGIYQEGAEGGNGGNGGAAGAGGAATASIDTLDEDSLVATAITLEATGGAAGLQNGDGDPTGGGIGGTGGDGGETSAGGNGGFGGNGGAATANLSDSTMTDAAAITIDLSATGGAGGTGGVGGAGGYSNVTGQFISAPYTDTTENGENAPGGAGGANGLAVVDASGNSLATPFAWLTFTAVGGAPGDGGKGGTDLIPPGETTDAQGDVINVEATPAGANGPNGASVAGQMTITDNAIMVSRWLNLSMQIDAYVSGAETPQPLDGAVGGNLVFSGNSLIGGGTATLDVANCGTGGTVDDLNGVLSLAGSPGNLMTGFSEFILGPNDVFVAGDNDPQIVQVASDPDTIVLTPGHAAVTLDGAASNVVLAFQGYGAALSLGQVQADTTASDGGVTLDVAGDGAVYLETSEWSASTGTVTFAPACFAAGTRIDTARGEVMVECLTVGERVRVVSGALRPVRWLGRRHVDCRRHPKPETVWPVRVTAGAFGTGVPARDLFLSPDHAVFVGGVLIPVRCLQNGRTIARAPMAAVTYWHVELDTHDVLLAERLPCETFLDTGQRAAFENGGAVVDLHPAFSRRVWDGAACAPLVVAGPVLARVRARLSKVSLTGTRMRRPLESPLPLWERVG